MLLARAALYRDRMEKNPEVPTFAAVAERSSEVVVKGTKNGQPEKS
jgi:hypothetical protein